MSGIFISYRRDDSMGFAGRLEDDLSERFGDELIFRDREIPAGSDFTRILHETLSTTDVMLVVIGRNWENARNRNSLLRLHDKDDWVRQEIETALDRKVPVIPILVGKATMPHPDNLPESLIEFSKRQAFPLSDRRWHQEVDELAILLTRISPILDVRLRTLGQIEKHDSIAGAIRDIGDRVIDEAIRGKQKREKHHENIVHRGFLSRTFRKLFAFSILATIIFIIIRTNGGVKINHELDQFIYRLSESFQAIF